MKLPEIIEKGARMYIPCRFPECNMMAIKHDKGRTDRGHIIDLINPACHRCISYTGPQPFDWVWEDVGLKKRRSDTSSLILDSTVLDLEEFQVSKLMIPEVVIPVHLRGDAPRFVPDDEDVSNTLATLFLQFIVANHQIEYNPHETINEMQVYVINGVKRAIYGDPQRLRLERSHLVSLTELCQVYCDVTNRVLRSGQVQWLLQQAYLSLAEAQTEELLAQRMLPPPHLSLAALDMMEGALSSTIWCCCNAAGKL